MLTKLAESDLLALWKLKKDQLFQIEILPYLGSGKLGFKNIEDAAAELAGTQT